VRNRLGLILDEMGLHAGAADSQNEIRIALLEEIIAYLGPRSSVVRPAIARVGTQVDEAPVRASTMVDTRRSECAKAAERAEAGPTLAKLTVS